MAVEPAVYVSGSIKKTTLDREITELKYLTIYTPDTADAGDTFTVDLAVYGGSTFLGLEGFKHTTNNSVIVAEDHTTAVTGTTVTITIPAGTDNDLRVAKLYFY